MTTATETTPDEGLRVLRLQKLEQGDVLVMFFPLAASQEQRDRIAAPVQKLFPDNEVLTMDSVIRLEVFRPEKA